MVDFVAYVQHMLETGNKNSKTAVLLANLGTPEAPRRAAVARFLREFLSDPRVVDLPRYLWLPLLYLIIIPLRAGRSAAAYRKIWWPEGSPLLVLTQRLGDQLAMKLTGKAVVDIGMRYGEPSIHKGTGSISSIGCIQADRPAPVPAVFSKHHLIHLRCGGTSPHGHGMATRNTAD